MPKKANYKQQLFSNVDQDKAFWASNGAVIRSLYGLSEALEHMEEHDFKNHVNESKNDFANWVEGVCGESELAKKLNHSTDRMEHATTMLRHFVGKLK